MLRELGIRLVVYIDNVLLMASSEALAREHTQTLVCMLETLRVCCAPREDNKRPISGNKISGDENSLLNNGATAPTSKGEETPGRSISPQKIDNPAFGEGGILPARKDEFSIAGNSTQSLILQNDSNRPLSSLRERSAGLREPLPEYCRQLHPVPYSPE